MTKTATLSRVLTPDGPQESVLPVLSLDQLASELRVHAKWDGAHGTAVLMMLRDVIRELPSASQEAENVSRLSVLEEIKSAAAAAQMRETIVFRQKRIDRETIEGVPASRRGKGLGSEIALARRESPAAGSRFLGMARVMDADMPHALAALTDGRMNEFTATMLVREVITLPAPACHAVDEQLTPEYGNLGTRALTARARALAYQAEPHIALARHEIAREERRVTVRPAADGMAFFTALIPTTQAFACKKSLMLAAATERAAGDCPPTDRTPGTGTPEQSRPRSGAQMEADILVQRLTGQTHPDTIPVELHVVMTDEAVFGMSGTALTELAGLDDTTARLPAVDSDGRFADPVHASAWVPGIGPICAQMARDLLDPRHDPPPGTTGSQERVFLRRILTDPITGQITAMDTRKRAFTGTLRRALILRDDRCRTPYCGAPIVHLDHTHPFAAGGRTNPDNGTGLCARCNFTKEHEGWRHQRSPATNALTITTPTGHSHTTTPPPPLPQLSRTPALVVMRTRAADVNPVVAQSSR